MTFPDYGTLGKKVLTQQLADLEAQAFGRVMTNSELYEKKRTEKALAEVKAALRARARIPEGRWHPLNVVRLQMEELDKAGLTYDCNPDDLEAIRKEDARK